MFGRLRLHSRKVAYGVRQYGLRYVLNAPGNELRNPRLALTRFCRSAIVSVGDLLHRARPGGSTLPDDCLVFAYDLGASPVTFDFATFLAGVELERRRRGLAAIYVLFIPGPHEGLRRELPSYEAGLSVARRHWRIRHVLVPLLAFLPSVRGYRVCASREEAEAAVDSAAALVPGDFRVWLPREPDKRLVHARAAEGSIFPMLRATSQSLAVVAAFLEAVGGRRRPIVITLRNSPTSMNRNSRVDEWRTFIDGLDRERFVPIFIDDTEAPAAAPPEALGRETFCEAARWNLEVRMALYETAWLNMAVMHGPMELCWYNERARYVVFLEPNADASSSEQEVMEGGLAVGRDLSFATPFQRIVWRPDRAPIIREAFDDMAGRIAGAETAGGQQR